MDSERPSKLMTIKDVAERLGVGIPSVRSYRAVAQKNRMNGIQEPADMPKADLYISSIPVWYSMNIELWITNRPGRGRKVDTSEKVSS